MLGGLAPAIKKLLGGPKHVQRNYIANNSLIIIKILRMKNISIVQKAILPCEANLSSLIILSAA